MLEYLIANPEVVIATIFTALGFFIRTLIQLYIDYKKKKLEFKEIIWKEKIQAAKKASEFYYEHLSYLNLSIQDIESKINNKIYSDILSQTFQKQLKILSKRISNPKDFGHHHINIFYDFDDKESNILNKKTFEILQDMELDAIQEANNSEEIAKKADRISANLNLVRLNLKETVKIYKGYLSIIRKDIAGFIN